MSSTKKTMEAKEEKKPREPSTAPAEELFGATPQMLLSAARYDYTPFQCDSKRAYFVNGRNEGGETELIKLFEYEKANVNENFPNATFCYQNVKDPKYVSTNELFYDIFCPHLTSAVLQLPDDRKVNAVYVRDLGQIHSYGKVRLIGENENFHEIDQSVKPCTMEDFVKKKIKDGKVSCWVIIDKEDFKWKVFPCLVEPPPPKSFTDLWKKMESYTYDKESCDFFGIVVFPGKILIQRYLVDCPKEYELGSTYMCQIAETFISMTSKSHILTKSEPFTFDPELIEIYIEDDGTILVKTVVGPMGIPKLKITWMNQYQNEQEKRFKKKSIFEGQEPKYNIVMHPFFGKIILPRNLVWSADSTQIIFTFLYTAVDGMCVMGRGIPFALAVHDGFNMVRLPIHLKTTIPAIRILIKNDVNLKDGVVEERENEINLLPYLPFKGYQIDGSVLSRRYAKPCEKDIEEEKPFIRIQKPETHVSNNQEQNPRQSRFY